MIFGSRAALIVALIAVIQCQNEIQRLNGQDAFQLDSKKFSNVVGSQCSTPGDLCVGDKVGQCVNSKIIVTTSCNPPLKCQVLPLVNKRGVTVTCDTEEDKQARFQQAGVVLTAVGQSQVPSTELTASKVQVTNLAEPTLSINPISTAQSKLF